jgi:short-subunit dehydrogenase
MPGMFYLQLSPYFTRLTAFRSKFALEGFTKSVAQELNPKWNIHLLTFAPGGVRTNFVSNFKLFGRHPAYENDPESALNKIMTYMSQPEVHATWADPDDCAKVLFDAVVSQETRPLPRRICVGADAWSTCDMEMKSQIKENDEWKDVAVSVTKAHIESLDISNLRK